MLEKEGGCELVDHRCVAWRIIAWQRGRRWDRGRLAPYESCAKRFRSCGALRRDAPVPKRAHNGMAKRFTKRSLSA